MMNYTEQCNKYFAPLDEIGAALVNNEGVNGVSSQELRMICNTNKGLLSDLEKYESCAQSDDGEWFWMDSECAQ